MKVNLYLKNYKAKKTSAVYLDFSYDGYRLQLSAGISINPSLWSKSKAFPKAQIANYDAYREHLERVKGIIERFYLEEKSKGITPHPTVIKKHLESKISQREILKDGKTNYVFHYDEFIESKSQLSPRSIQILKGCLKELIAFTAELNLELTFENINSTFFIQYKNHLLEKKNTNANCISRIGYVDDTISKRMSCIKSYMKWAFERKYHINTDYTCFKHRKASKNDNIVLSEHEFSLIKTYDFSLNKKLERVRDLFLFGIYTGQRWSDISTFHKKDLIVNDGNTFWKFVPKKTKTKVLEIPFEGFIAEGLNILKKYDYALPNISSQKFNDYLKEIGELVGLNTRVMIRRFSGKNLIEREYKKFELMSSHMARRTCVTFLLQQGMPHTTVMKLTGHSDVKTLMKYENTSTDALVEALKKIHKPN